MAQPGPLPPPDQPRARPPAVPPPPGPPTTRGRWDALLRVPSPAPSSTRVRDRYLDAAVDRLLVDAVDVADADPDAVARGLRAAQGPRDPADVEVWAVHAALEAIRGRAWGPALPWHGRQDIDAQALGRLARWRAGATLLQGGAILGDAGHLPSEVWRTASRVVAAVGEARRVFVDERNSLAGVLDTERRSLEDPDAAWDDALLTIRAERAPRYRFRAFFDPGSGQLLWSASPEAHARWDYPADHFELPIPLGLARRVQEIVDRYDFHEPHLAPDRTPFTGPEWAAFAVDYRATLGELRRALGPAYVIVDQADIT